MARPTWVYPRPRGGASTCSPLSFSKNGLSPPTRGSPGTPRHLHDLLGSIPAHAGEPNGNRVLRCVSKVYPRPRGGAKYVQDALRHLAGLSPPTRGSRSGNRLRGESPRSIPAHAGEPVPFSPSLGACRVYPRPRGGAESVMDVEGTEEGLSPPTRGSQYLLRANFLPAGSIPAHAGEPLPNPRATGPYEVYPRPRGGAERNPPATIKAQGLSPPTRGSLAPAVHHVGHVGSIPAHAGEPISCEWSAPRSRVYPRPRGGASCSVWNGRAGSGLSPPTRGSQPFVYAERRFTRSIPAHAGEPSSRSLVNAG